MGGEGRDDLMEGKRGRRTQVGTQKAKRLKYYRTSKAYYARSSEGLLVRDTERIQPTKIVSEPTISVSGGDNNCHAWPTKSVTLALAERATAPTHRHEMRRAAAARAAGLKPTE